MSYVRHYIMQASVGRGDELRQALSELEAALRERPGSLDVELLHDLENPEKFYFIEHWDTPENHRAAGPLLPNDVMKRLGATLSGPPAAASLSSIKAD